MLSKYIFNLLETHNRVIVPDLGAFLLKGDASKTIYFNEFLRYNDEILLNYIAEQQKIEKTDAARLIKQFSSEVYQKLQSDKSVPLQFIGTLYHDSNGKIQLRPLNAISEDFLEEMPGNENRFGSKKKGKEVLPVHEGVSSSSPYFSEEAESVEEQFKLNYPFREVNEGFFSAFNKKRLLTVGILLFIVIVVGYFIFTQPSGETRTQFSPVSDTSTRESRVNAEGESLSKQEENHKAGIKELEKKKLLEDTVVYENTRSLDIKQSESSTETGKHNENKSDTVSYSVQTSGNKYYLIAGSFSLESNANILKKKLIQNGYKAEKIKLSNGHFHVCYGSYSNKKEANSQLQYLNSIGKKDVWIFHF